jgi:hypothetical protein
MAAIHKFGPFRLDSSAGILFCGVGPEAVPPPIGGNGPPTADGMSLQISPRPFTYFPHRTAVTEKAVLADAIGAKMRL